MANTAMLDVQSLKLDLKNYRTVRQSKEADAIKALIAIDTEWYWALMESLLEDGYLPHETIITLQGPNGNVVREGNRRISALKLILGHVAMHSFDLPTHIQEAIGKVTPTWKKDNSQVPCTIYAAREAAQVDRIVALIHGKGEKAGRVSWNAVARARHNRDEAGAAEPALDMFEKYLKHGTNLTQTQKERWAGQYPLTVLEEAMKRIASRVGSGTAKDLAKSYPKIPQFKSAVNDIMRDIGLQQLRYGDMRDEHNDFFHSKYGIPAATQTAKPTATQTTSSTTSSTATTKPKAFALNDPKSVSQALRAFTPRGHGRQKVATLLDEMKKLKLGKHPHAFCFLLRSMFEISAKAYCTDHASKGGPSLVKQNGEDRKLVDVLQDINAHLIKSNPAGTKMKQRLHGAGTELSKSSGILSVTSMNQLVHNPTFSVVEGDICSLFHKIFPLLEEMNS